MFVRSGRWEDEVATTAADRQQELEFFFLAKRVRTNPIPRIDSRKSGHYYYLVAASQGELSVVGETLEQIHEPLLCYWLTRTYINLRARCSLGVIII